jgi:hypothetical protein
MLRPCCDVSANADRLQIQNRHVDEDATAPHFLCYGRFIGVDNGLFKNKNGSSEIDVRKPGISLEFGDLIRILLEKFIAGS